MQSVVAGPAQAWTASAYTKHRWNGGTIIIRLVLKNQADRPLAIIHPDLLCDYSIVIKRGDGSVVPTHAADCPFISLASRLVSPGEEVNVRLNLANYMDHLLPPGHYAVEVFGFVNLVGSTARSPIHANPIEFTVFSP